MGRRVTRTEYDGSITVLADRFDGKRLNSPNDIVCAARRHIWFTDPPFGIPAGGRASRRRRKGRPGRLPLDPDRPAAP
jgi:gluconolactonase